MKIGAVIVAAGLSSRMQAFKPMLTLGKSTIIGTTIETLEGLGIRDIVVVTGREAESLKAHLPPWVKCVYNADFAVSDMFCSACLGLSAVGEDLEAVFFSPADAPLLNGEALLEEVKFMEKTGCDILTPSCCGKKGHPLLIKKAVIKKLLEFKGDGGLRGAVENINCKKAILELKDFGIIMDADFPEDYERLKAYAQRFRWEGHKIPTKGECLKMLEQAGTPKEVISHCMAVSFTAVALGEKLNLQSSNALSLELLSAGGFLHDICRSEKNHAKAGGERLFKMGFYDIAYLVAQHMEPLKNICLDEVTLLWLADKCCDGNVILNPVMRFAAKRQRYLKNPEALEKIEKSEKSAEAAIELFEKAVGEDFSITLDFIRKNYYEKENVI
ncbi:MAG: NTP transferase domain-containing protein [Oscillospiraceae bacterium]